MLTYIHEGLRAIATRQVAGARTVFGVPMRRIKRPLVPSNARRARVDFALVRINDGPMAEMNREEVDAKLAATEARVEARIANLETIVKTGFADVRTQMAELRQEMAELRTDLSKAIVSIIKWGVALSLAVVGTTVGLLHFISK